MKAGQYEDIESSIVHDDAPDETTLLRAARITSFASLSSVCSFYNAAGQVEGMLFQDHTTACQLLCWGPSCTQGSHLPAPKDTWVAQSVFSSPCASHALPMQAEPDSQIFSACRGEAGQPGGGTHSDGAGMVCEQASGLDDTLPARQGCVRGAAHVPGEASTAVQEQASRQHDSLELLEGNTP